MKPDTLINYIKAPQSLDLTHYQALDIVIQQFPFFQTAHLLSTKSLYQNNPALFQKTLKKTAIVVNNRGRLYYLINMPSNLIVEDVREPKTEIINDTIKEPKEASTDVVTELTSNYTYTNADISDHPINQDTPPHFEIDYIKEVENETQHINLSKLTATVEDVEKEIEKSLVNALIDKEIINADRSDNSQSPAVELKTNERYNFTQWLNQVNKQTEPLSSKTKSIVITPTDGEKEKQRALIDKIIDHNPGHIRLTSNKFYTPDQKAKESLLENEHLVTETLAKIYALQGNINKAIRAYEILSLKFPQKSAYFATLIEKLKKND